MKRASIAGLAFVLAALCARAQTQSPPPASDAAVKAKLDQAIEKTDLTSDKTPAYRLHAKVTFHGWRTPFPPAEYTLLWADPIRWRAEARWPDLTAVEVVSGDRIWKKDTDARRIALSSIHRALDFARVLNTEDARVSGPQSKTINGAPVVCIKMTRTFRAPNPPPMEPPPSSATTPPAGPAPPAPDIPPIAGDGSVTSVRDACLLAANGLPLQMKEPGTTYDFAPGDYLALGMKRFPRRIVHSFHQGSLEIEVDSFEPLDPASADAITPPAGSASLPWCRDQKAPRLLTPSATGQIYGLNYAVFDVTEDGTVKDVRAYNVHGSRVNDKSMLDKLHAATFHPSSCGGKMVEAEIVFYFFQ